MPLPNQPVNFEALLTREQVAAALRAEGYPVASKTLATKATRGGGPPYRKFGARALYRWGDALQWAQRRLTGPIVTTSEGDTIEANAELRRCGLLAGSVSDHRPRATMPLHRPDAHREDDARRIAWARHLWDTALPAAGSPVVRYLASRGITMPPPASLRWAPRCWHREARQWLPAMIACVEHIERGIVGVHRTYLRRDGSGKADLPKNWQKLSLGPIGGGAVRFGMPREGEWLAIGEGIETTLSVMTACAMPAWAALSAGGIRALILPAAATHVLICSDHDASGVGQNAAHDAAARWLAEGRRVRIALPPEPDTDFADALAAGASAPAEASNVA